MVQVSKAFSGQIEYISKNMIIEGQNISCHHIKQNHDKQPFKWKKKCVAEHFLLDWPFCLQVHTLQSLRAKISAKVLWYVNVVHAFDRNIIILQVYTLQSLRAKISAKVLCHMSMLYMLLTEILSFCVKTCTKIATFEIIILKFDIWYKLQSPGCKRASIV